MGSKRGGRRVKRRTQKKTDSEIDAADLPPRAFVFAKGSVPSQLKALVNDLKYMLSPNTATALRAQKRNKLRDFVDVAGPLHVSFFLIVSATAKNSYLRLVRSPRGPTLTFRIQSFSISSDLAASARKPYSPSHAVWQTAPVLILSNFDKSVQHESLSSTMVQNLFPTLNVATARLMSFRRVVLVHQLPESEGGGCELRQYVIEAAPTGISKGVKRLMRATNLPSLGRYADITDYLNRGGYSSESGAETDEEEKADLPQDYAGRNARKSQRVSIKLHEVGPRVSLSLLKVEEGLCDGATLYHSLVSKTEGEAAETEAKIQARAALKAERKQRQQDDVNRKRQAKDKASTRTKRQRGARSGAEEAADDNDLDDEVDDDEDWYRAEVGEEPEEQLALAGRETKPRPKSTRAPKRKAT